MKINLERKGNEIKINEPTTTPPAAAGLSKYNFDLSIPLQNPRPACTDSHVLSLLNQACPSLNFYSLSHTSLNITEHNQCYLKNTVIDKMII